MARRGGSAYPVQVVAGDADRVELEIAGERVVVEGWPVGLPSPPSGGLAVNGEAVSISAVERGSAGDADVPTRPVVAAPASSPSRVPSSGPTPGVGAPIAPAMPGKVVELRVKEGDSVAAGQVVLVLEAMKMRNEVTAPVAGRVAELRVAVGANVRARDPMLRIVPG